MGENKKLRKQIAGWLKQIDKHEAKIAAELEKPNPNHERVAKRRKDVRIFESNIAKAARRLPGGRR